MGGGGGEWLSEKGCVYIKVAEGVHEGDGGRGQGRGGLRGRSGLLYFSTYFTKEFFWGALLGRLRL